MCHNPNTTDTNNKFPKCGAVGCKHVKCANCTQLTDEDEEGTGYNGEEGYLGGIAAGLSAPAPPQAEPRARWYCVSVVKE